MALFRLNASTGVPLYIQLMEQVKHAVETGALQPGDQLPSIRVLAQELTMNSNTVVRAYRELEHEGVVELHHGLGVFISMSVSHRDKLIRQAHTIVQSTMERLRALGVTEQEIRRLVESEFALMRTESITGRRQ